MKIVRLHATNPETHTLLKPALERVMEFTTANDSDADPSVLFAELAASYFHQEPSTCLWVGLDESEKIVAHLFATIDNYYGGRFLTIHQLWKDPDVTVTEDDRDVMFGNLHRWAKATGCKDIRIYAMNKIVADIFEKGYGFVPTERVMMSMPIEDSEEK
jgi:hypothetical protein